ncbi:hypothetical protein NECAME_12874 [Necator americanus]|uniref:Uncharacterized protein n=1 Tax=Necator americanus TaxID=51031 RepID=W2SXW4_NECAM|nr:hypothetical protein NECAME_12874 [Necator americanus]ETN74604.1 hypothetical protein NECAME_12874 [Necator americanus]
MSRQALTVFLRENWQNTDYETVDVNLLRDPALGLGITVAGYVHRKGKLLLRSWHDKEVHLLRCNLNLQKNLALMQINKEGRKTRK